MGKQRAILIRLNNTFKEKVFKTDQNKLLYEKKKETRFEPISVFSEEKPRWKFWRSARNLIFFVDGALEALKFGAITKDMRPFWTQKEIDKIVKKKMAEALTEHKPMKWSQVILLFIGLMANLVILIAIAQRLGIF